MEEDKNSTSLLEAPSKKELKRRNKREQYKIAKQQKKAEKRKLKSGNINTLPGTSSSAENTSENTEAQPTNSSTEALHASISTDLITPPISNSVDEKTRNRKQDKTEDFLKRCEENFHIIIDCDWEHEHNETSLKSLTQQIMYCYGFNRKHAKPSFIHISNLKGNTKTYLSTLKFENWMGVTSSEEDYLSDSRFSKTDTDKEENNDNDHANDLNQRNEKKKQLIYLTADADETLYELQPHHAYILGGIVDRNRLRGITQQKAQQQGIRSAKLPIKEHVSLASSQVLTINHVHQILLQFNKTKDWSQTLEEVLPKRKEATGKRAFSAIS